jgi:predicted DNA repair protein MutK
MPPYVGPVGAAGAVGVGVGSSAAGSSAAGFSGVGVGVTGAGASGVSSAQPLRTNPVIKIIAKGMIKSFFIVSLVPPLRILSSLFNLLNHVIIYLLTVSEHSVKH